MTAAGKGQDRTVAPLQLCVFDVRRGRIEGQEPDRVLGFYPGNVSPDEQASVVGLVQAMTAFSSIFTQEEPCRSMHAESSVWIMHECEPSLWMLLVAQRAWFSGPVRDQALKEALKQLHAVSVLLHGPLQRRLDEDPSGGAARGMLGGLLLQWGDRLASSRGSLYQALHNPLSAREGVPWLPLPRHLFTSVQALVSRLLIAQVVGTVPVQGALLMHEHWCLWSSLGRGDAAALVRLASLTLLPAAHAAEQPSLGSRITSTLRWQEAKGAVRHMLDRKAWCLLPPGFLVLQPPPRADAGSAVDLPQIWLQDSNERCGLLALRAGGCLLLLLLAERVAGSMELLAGLAHEALPSLTAIAQGTAAELSSANQWHIPGMRYVYMDEMLLAVRASPASKVATLSRDSQALLHSVRASLDKSLAGDTDVIVRGAHDCWVVARRLACRSIAIVLEGRGLENLSDALKAAEKYLTTHFASMLN